MKESVELFGEDSPATVLKPDLSSGIDPDDYFSSIPYEKGFNLLYHIEKTVGGPAIFEPYMKAHVERFASKSITTDDWLAHIHEYMEKNHGKEVLDKLKSIDFNLWINGAGMPPVDPNFDTSLADACYNLAARWDAARTKEDLSEFSPKDIESFTSTQKSKLFDLPPPILLVN